MSLEDRLRRRTNDYKVAAVKLQDGDQTKVGYLWVASVLKEIADCLQKEREDAMKEFDKIAKGKGDDRTPWPPEGDKV